MNISIQSLLGKPLVFLDTERGKIIDILFFPETGKISGFIFRNQKQNKHKHKHIFLPSEYISFSKKTPVVLNELVWRKRKKTKACGISLLSLSVYSRGEKKKKLGFVADVFFDTQVSVLTSILVSRTIFGIPFLRKIFSKSRIRRITKEEIIVDDTPEKIPASYALQYG